MKEKMLITKLDCGQFYKVEVWDKYGDYVGVCEESIEDCRKYAQSHYDSADKRKASRDSWGECVKEMIKEDRKRGFSWD
tara:strand:- start:673 stop:909 length:237 start_codon:yes stop_codon:yes gene_type:complete